jgi:hypothetical protein
MVQKWSITSADDPWRPKNDKWQIFSSVLIALQCHDKNSKVYFKSIQVKPLPKQRIRSSG